jgi:subtilisin family serine protease
MKKSIVFSVFIVFAIILVGLVLPTAAQDNHPPEEAKIGQAERAKNPVADFISPDWGGTWQYGPDTDFEFTRFDGEYYPDNGLVYFMGGRLADSNTDGSVWSFDPVAGTYADMGVDLVTPISNYTMNLLQDGAGDWGFYVLCGRPAAGGIIASVQVYYPDTNTVVQLDPGDDYPGSVSCTSGLNVVYDNKVYVAGGFDATANTDETWVFDPTAPLGSKWTQIATATLDTARAYIMGAIVDDLIYAVGGSWFDGSTLLNVTTVEVLDPTAPSPVWDDGSVADLPEECSSSKAYGFDTGSPYSDPDGTPLGGKIVSGCGFWPDENNHVYVYDSTLDFWEAFPFFSEELGRRDHAAAFIPPGGEILENGMPGMWVWGGRQDLDTNVLVSSEYYDTEQDICNILLVDDDWDQYSGQPYNGTGHLYYTTTLDTLGYPYDRWDVWTLGDPALDDMLPYDVVVWFTGYAWNGTITITNEADLSAFLDAGGSVLVSSEDYLYDQGVSAFGTTYLGISSHVDDVGEYDPTGNPGDPIGDGLGPYLLTVPTSWPDPTEPMYTDYVYPGASAGAPFSYQATGEDNSTDLDGGTWMTAFLGWPLEGLDDLNDRVEVLGNALDWFCAPPLGTMNLIPPSQVGSGIPGATVPYTLTVVNDLGSDETFTITYDSVWTINGPDTVGPISTGATEDFAVTVDVPLDVNCYDSDIADIMAIAQSSPVISDTATIETSADPAGVSDFMGVVYDANTGLGIPEAYVSLDLADEFYDMHTASDGSYLFVDVPSCEYEGLYAAVGYDNLYSAVVLSAGVPYTMDVNLDASWPALSDASVSVAVPPDSLGFFDLGLTNDGTGELDFHISEVPNDAIYPLPSAINAMPSGVDPQVYTDLATSIDGTADFIVYMAEQADLSAAFGIENWTDRGRYVLDTLQDVAQSSQLGVRAQLDAAGATYESRYIVNALVVKGDIVILDTLASRPDVAYIGPNTAIETPEPVEMNQLLDDIDAVAWGVAQVRGDEVWADFGATGDGIVVSNIDTGVDYDHVALVNQYRGTVGVGTYDHNYNWWDPYGYGPTVPYDFHSHGSHTMGTMLGDDGGANQIGMAPTAQWFSCQGFDQYTGYGYNAELLECAEFILAPWDLGGANPDPNLRAHVVNNSWGGGQAQWWYNQAIYAWRAAGIFPAFSAGNEGPACETMGDPGDMLNVMAVGATDSTDTIAGFSSRGPASVTGLTKPNVSAPGVSIYSAYNDGTFGLMGGTSMASPHVAGEAALLWSAQPELMGDVQLTYWVIEQTAEPITTTQGCGGDLPTDVPNNTYGWGRIDAYEAVSMSVNANWDMPWLMVEPLSGTVETMGNTDVSLTFDTTGLTFGECYTGTLKFEYNDPYVMEEFVPVELCVNYTYGVELAPDTDGLTGEPGEMVEYTLSLTNSGNFTDIFDVTFAGNDPAWVVHLPDTSFELGAGDSTSMIVHVTVPIDANDGDNDTVTITATSQGDNMQTASSVLTTTAVVSEPPMIYLPVVFKE